MLPSRSESKAMLRKDKHTLSQNNELMEASLIEELEAVVP